MRPKAHLRRIKQNADMTSPAIEDRPISLSRSLSSIARLYGPKAIELLARSHVAVVGLGGVGSWAAEALARSGLGQLTLIDSDHVSQSNLNRQVQAMQASLGKSKVDALSERLLGIGLPLQIHRVDAFLCEDNISQLLATGPDFWIDACDDRKAKQLLIQALPARQRPFKLIVCGAAGGKTDPTRIRCDDLSKATHDPLLARLRSELRRATAAKKPSARLNVQVVYSQEPVRQPVEVEGDMPKAPAGLSAGGYLACAGYGSSVAVTASMGMAAAAFAIECLLRRLVCPSLSGPAPQAHFSPSRVRHVPRG
jgi:tRNA threonylcarbamoyladenosine dehydratase